MADSRAQTLLEQGDQLFGKRSSFMSLLQEIALNFYPERADFLFQRTLGNTFADNLMTSYPLVARRDLGNSLGAMLRPKDKEWFGVTTTREDRLDLPARRWLDQAKSTMRRAMYDRVSQFTRATKEGDHDFAAFGQCVISVELAHDDRAGPHLLYRNWHLRDVAWCENARGQIDTIHRKWKLTARDIVRLFPKTVSAKVRELAEKPETRYTELELRHVVLPSADYDYPEAKKIRQPFVSVFLEVDGAHVLEETGSWTRRYIIPRWQTVSGSQYAYSPATVAALPDARLIQAMTLTLLEAGEKLVNPPLIATHDVVRGDIAMYAGGLNFVEAEYDERLGEAIRPMKLDMGGMPLGRDLRNDIKEAIAEAFYLNKLALPAPEDGHEMTATEAAQRVQEYIRQALPLFEPMEMDYNGELCDMSFDLLMRNGAFGRTSDMPRSLAGQEVTFRFTSPLSEALDAQKGDKLVAAKQLMAQVIDIDPTAAHILDAGQALRDSLIGIGVPPRWTRDAQEVADIAKAQADAAQQQQTLAAMEQGSNIVKNLGQAGVFQGSPDGAQPAPAQGLAA
jgi:hypothetical protein